MKLGIGLVILLMCELLNADPVVHKFQLWGEGTQRDKVSLYWGWTNGFFQARGAPGLELATCLERLTTDQAVAMIDRRYKDHPERWSRPFGEQILEALTVAGGPCEGKNPLVSVSK